MRRFELKKDLPTFKAGETFYLNAYGSLCADCRQGRDELLAYRKSTLDKFPNILTEWFEEIAENEEIAESRLPSISIGDRYYYIADYSEVMGCRWNGDIVDVDRGSIGNIFKSPDEAQKALDYLKAVKVIKDDTGGFEPNWDDEVQGKWSGYYNHNNGYLGSTVNYRIHDHGSIYFASFDEISRSMRIHRKEWLTLLGVNG